MYMYSYMYLYAQLISIYLCTDIIRSSITVTTTLLGCGTLLESTKSVTSKVITTYGGNCAEVILRGAIDVQNDAAFLHMYIHMIITVI